MSFKEAKKFVLQEYEKVGPGDARWYIPEYWFNVFELDTPLDSVLSSVNYVDAIYEDTSVIQDLSKNYTIIISTNNPRSMLKHKLTVFKYTDHISYTFSSVSDFSNIVKSRQFYVQVCSKLGTKPKQVLHVGDDPFYDVSEPCVVGMNAILIDRSGKNSTIRSFYDLRSMLKNH